MRFLLLTILGVCCMLENVVAQAPFVPLNDDYYHLIDRYEVKRNRLSEAYHVAMKPFQRTAVLALVDSLEADRQMPLNHTDFFNLQYLKNDSWEWTSEATPMSRRPFWKRFYKKPADLFYVQDKNFDLHVSPVTHLILGQENTSDDYLWLTSRGVELRGTVGKKVGFYSYVTDSQGMFGQYVRDYTQTVRAPDGFTQVLPAEGQVKTLRRLGTDFTSARGYISVNPIKQINLQFGHDRNFIGSGYRSLLLSDWSAPYLFLKATTKLGRFHYTNIWANMMYNQANRASDEPRNKKYAAIHHLSINLSKNFSLGIFEAEMYGRENNKLDANYFNPIIFYRFVEFYLGSSDNAFIGVDVRWNFLKHFGFYSQFIMDEFKTSEYFSVKGSWAKKFGFQAGLKYIDAFGIKNLDLQGELNLVRPYTYAHKSGFNNYIHFDLPLAHPLGANFWEGLGIVRYQPSPKLTFYGTLMRSRHGVDIDGRNWGGNIHASYEVGRPSNTGNFIGQGTPIDVSLIDMRVSYMLKHNFFIDGRLMMRNQESPREALRLNTTSTTFGLRLNIPYRQQIF
ncbi:MAG: hypothetical protein MUE30_09630 [Spirosomaceae bacterium]|nr:hypothetical protein [Spirosomataceae bacterium]